MEKILTCLLLWLTITASAQNQPLTVPYIMRHPKWMGSSPENIRWADDGKTIYFDWGEDKSLHAADPQTGTWRKVALEEQRALAFGGQFNTTRTKRVYAKDGDIFIKDVVSGSIIQLTKTTESEAQPRFSDDNNRVFFLQQNNLFAIHLKTGMLEQLTDFRKGNKPAESPKTEQALWLEADQQRLFEVLRERKITETTRKTLEEQLRPQRLKAYYFQEKSLDNFAISPDGNFVLFRVGTRPSGSKPTAVPNYLTTSGYTENLNARPKVGDQLTTYEIALYDRRRDTLLYIATASLPGINQPAAAVVHSQKSRRELTPLSMQWSENSRYALIVLRAQDNKDLWIAVWDVQSGSLKNIDHQHDEAWIGGPGIGSNIGWIDNQNIWFQSEETGWSHLYTANVESGAKKALTSGNYEVRFAQLSRDKKHFYIATSEVHPGEEHLYKIPVAGGVAQRLTFLTGGNEFIISPNEQFIAIRHSYSNRPWELYVMENKPNAKPRQITQSQSDEFRQYKWRDPEVLTFKAADGATVYARLYQPLNETKNGAAVIFVHGAGYLQNAHKRWSTYFREYMFHNLLADKGYTVLDIDYRGSAGYGRDWRTGIYRHMGGKDLSDHIDGAKFLVENYDIDPQRIGIYGGSYGGFITLMAMFTAPEVFAAGAALRPVTHWAHYNHGYTSNILNTPVADSIAYVKSSPIYHAQGLKGALLICHGMVDVNVHFQDVVLLAQRLIELGKDNWEVAIYPVEDHGFTEPSSWTDEYKRILKLFDEKLIKR
ncbi:MAG: prolyl oligopeptidase family serine peptidase [Cytophagales bacterium]|nr:prolyl oligopeptidase family serine peptidase [Bernardetiaceae bacterium]MDW8204851.1 prolyl oligopeptidase family serine peptidase [Cytophagales bacterium]